jgi:hypothetical protein
MINRVHNRAAPSSEVELRQRESSTCRSVRTRSIRLVRRECHEYRRNRPADAAETAVLRLSRDLTLCCPPEAAAVTGAYGASGYRSVQPIYNTRPSPGSEGIALIWLSHNRSAMGPGAARSVDPVRAGNGPVIPRRGWPSDHRSSMGSDAARSIHPAGAGGGLTLWGEDEHRKPNHTRERKVFHFRAPPAAPVQSSRRSEMRSSGNLNVNSRAAPLAG